LAVVGLSLLVLRDAIRGPTDYELRIDFEEEAGTSDLWLVQRNWWGLGGITQHPLRRKDGRWEYQRNENWRLLVGTLPGDAVDYGALLETQSGE
jgi:hypothetical protein